MRESRVASEEAGVVAGEQRLEWQVSWTTPLTEQPCSAGHLDGPCLSKEQGWQGGPVLM